MKMFKLSVLLAVAIVTTSLSMFAAAVERPAIANLVDTSSTAGAVSSSSQTHDLYPASRAFDKNKSDTNGRWLATMADNMYLVYKFNEPTAVNGLNVVAGHDSKGGSNSVKRAPKAWTFEGSNDGVAWTILDTQTSETGWSNGEERYYSFVNGVAYKFYKYNCTALNGAEDYLQLWELEFYKNVGFEYVAITCDDSSTFTVSGMLYDGIAGDVYSIITDGSTTVTNLLQAAVSSGSTFSFEISNLENDKTYQVSLLVQGEGFSLEEPAGEIYTAALSLSNPVNANEQGLIPGSVTVSRANADDFPLTVNYTINSIANDAAEGVTWMAPTPVIIPAGATSVELPVAPLWDKNINDDIELIISLADGNYSLPADNAVNVTIINQQNITETSFLKKREITLSTSTLEKIGEDSFADFPVLLRLPVEVSQELKTDDGTDILIFDEKGTKLVFDVEVFDPQGETLVWVKVPSLSAATQLTMFYSGSKNYENVSEEVWSDFVGVWHYSKGEADGTTIADSTANGLDGYPSVSGAVVSSYEEGPAGLPSLVTSSSINAPDYDSYLDDPAVFSMSGWFKLPSQVNSYVTFVSKKTGLAWDNPTGWYLEMKQSQTVANLVYYKSTKTFNIKDVSKNWNYFNVVSDGTKIYIYMNGSATPIVTVEHQIKSSGRVATIGANNGCFKEYRLRNSVATGKEAALEYATVADAQFFTYGEASAVDPLAPEFVSSTIARNVDGTYSITVEFEKNTCDVGVIYESENCFVTNIIATAAQPGAYTDVPANLPEDKTYMFYAYGIATTGTEVFKRGEIFYNGELSIEKLSDANENQLVPGVFRISRADTAYDLVVNLEVSGTAIGGQTYEALPTEVTIPAGSTYVDISIVPQIDASIDVDSSVVVSLGAGLYGIDASAASSEMTIINLVAPAGYNTWVASEDGLASEGSNWSKGRAPISSDKILFDGRFSSVNCTWDAAAVDTVASWKQESSYTGTVTFNTEFPDFENAVFTLFTISGDCTLEGGQWSCRGNYNNFGVTATPMNTYMLSKQYCLNVAVGGEMNIAEGASITATGRGYGFPTANYNVSQSYGGFTHEGKTSPYGSIKEPFDLGMGCSSQGDQKNQISGIGGGAIKLTIGGELINNGSIVALGTMDKNVPRSGGTGGSIWIVAEQISGSGKIDASACPSTAFTSDQAVSVGSGGRIAIYTDAPLQLPVENIACSGMAYSGLNQGSKTKVSGPGTIYIYDSTQENGTLYVKQSSSVATLNNVYTSTPVVGDIALDAVVMYGYTQLRVVEGSSLTLPSLSAVTSLNQESNGASALVYAGGTLNLGGGDQVLKSKVAFSAPAPYIFSGNLTLEEGAVLGAPIKAFGFDSSYFDITHTINVKGDLTIPNGALASATRNCAYTTGGKTSKLGSHGGQTLWLKAVKGYALTNGYDSILNPYMPGGSNYRGFNAGGVLNLVVDGVLTVDGRIYADGADPRGGDSTADGQAAGAGGSINIVAGELAGTTGSITANGGSARYSYAGGAGGGRIAIRLTGEDSVFTDYWRTNITAYGFSFATGKHGRDSSAGTVYLQDGTMPEAAGEVIIYNDFALQPEAINNLCTTRYPGNGEGCDTPETLKATSLTVSGAARVELTDSVSIKSAFIDENCLIDLAGHTLKVKTVNINGLKLGAGEYTAAQLEGKGAIEVIDSSESLTGVLHVLGEGLIIMIR